MRCSICAAYSGFSITSDSVSSSLSVPRATAGARQHRAQILDQVVAQQLARRDVDAGEQRLARPQRALPGAELARGALEHEQAELDDQAGFLGERDELVRRHAAQLRMIPAHQRLEAGDRAVLEPHDRLVEDRDLLALERAAQIGSRASGGRSCARASPA